MSDSTAEEPPHDKEEKVYLSRSCPLSSLPDEVAISCLARVPISDYAALSLVSKRYRSLMVSPELKKARVLMGYTKKCLYTCLITRNNSTPLWFILGREKTKKRLMSPFPSFPSQPPVGSTLVAFDWGIYLIGGRVNQKPSSDAWLLDCRNHTWRQIPSMSVARAYAAAGVVGGKIYVFGGCFAWRKDYPSSWGEVFDPNTQTWDTLVAQPEKDRISNDYFIRGLVMDEKVYAMQGDQCFYYSPKERKWGRKNLKASKLEISSYCCVKDRLLYGCDGYGNVFWCEPEEYEWKEVKGLELLRNIFPKPVNNGVGELKGKFKWYCELRNFGVNIVVIWFKDNYEDESIDIWCAEISLERHDEKGEIWGTIEWSEVVANLDRHQYDGKVKVDVLYSASVDV
ncbi:F-box/kelch-repeat protein SKIP6 [Cardamine amara subsp. amara]|uniref:F-box/kelch-repeat protein SKIP6 n=1 Tax=Cardamine amara subsp. amara TaxID=228776 RepID=A0ABD0Z6V0_CARAN